MKGLQRRMVGLGLVIVAGLPSIAVAQYGFNPARQRGPDRDTPHLLVGTCHATPATLGVTAAAALRDRIQSENNIRDLYVIPNKTVNDALIASGYAPDSALSQQDLGALGKIVRADEILDCDVALTPSGIREGARLMLATDVTQAQPLPAVDAKDPAGAAGTIERELSAARKQITGNEKCKNSLRAGKAQEAVANAQDAIKQYPQATLARLCLATAYGPDFLKYPPDSVLSVTNEILRIDPANLFALGLAVGAYDAKGDQDAVVQTMLKMYKLEPQDQALANRIINALGASDPAKALPILEDMLKQNPGDPTMLQQKWKLLAATQQWKDALATGELMAHIDTALADSDYYHRQIAMATTDSNWTKVAEYASDAERKYPKDPQFPFLQGVALRNTSQLPAAAGAFRRALIADPKDSTAELFLAQTFVDLGQTDSLVALANQAIAAGGDKAKWGPMLLAPVQNLMSQAKTDTANATKYYQRSLDLAQHADSVASSPTTHFFIGVASLQLAVAAMQAAQPTKHCVDAKRAQDMFVLSQINMPAGGSVDAATAGAVMQAIAKYSPIADQMVKAYCKKQ